MNQTPQLVQGIGRRKSAIAKVNLRVGSGEFWINKKRATNYLQENSASLLAIKTPLQLLNLETSYDTLIEVKGGGISSQTSAIQLGLARALCKVQSSYRDILKEKKFLTRDSRIKERKKYGLKKARKAPQFSKR